MVYHRFRLSYFGIKNINNIVCKLFGHRLNENPAHHWCERCGLEYGECYKPLDYWTATGIIKTEEAEKQAAIRFAKWTVLAYPFADTKLIPLKHKDADELTPIDARSDKFGNKFTYDELYDLYINKPKNK